MTSKVYFTRTEDDRQHPRCTDLLCESAGLKKLLRPNEMAGIKLHFGEPPNPGWIKPSSARVVSDIIKSVGAVPFLMETNTLYAGRRSDSPRHVVTALDHGFTLEACGAPVIISDGLRGQSQVDVEVPGAEGPVSIASDVAVTDTIVFMTHVTGHILTGMGGTLKNVGMGLSSRGGKLKQHSGSHPVIKGEKCIGCGRCLHWCPENAIELEVNQARIVDNLCSGCGQCLSVCPYYAVKFDWKLGSPLVQKRIAEHAAGVLLGRKALFISYLTHITPNCDCLGQMEDPMCSDIGIIASTDPVALDMATLDLVREHAGEDVFKKAWETPEAMDCIKHGEKLGLGSTSYSIVKLK